MMLSNLGPLMRQYALVIVVNLNLLSTGLALVWTSPVLVKLRNETDNPLPEPITEKQGSWIVSIGFLFGGLGYFICGYFVNTFGRKFTLIFAALPKLIGFLFLTFANSVWMLYFGRSALGFSDAFTFTVVPMYASEIASKDVRGSLGTILQIICSVGIVIMFCMGPFINYLTLNIVCTCVVVAAVIPVLFVPDSPYFLYTKGKKEEAFAILTSLRATIQEVKDEIVEYEQTNNSDEIRIRDLLKSKSVIKALFIVIIIGIGTQATGYNAVQFYLQTVLDSTETSVSSDIASVVVGCIQLFASLCTLTITDRFGRKPIICGSLTGMSIGLIGLGAFFKLSQNGFPISGFLQYLPLLSVVIVVYFYSAGLGSLMWPLLSELFDGQARALGMSVGLLSSVISIFLSTRFFAPLTFAIGPAATYWVFGANSIIFCVFILFFVPETKGRSFSEIQEVLGGKKQMKTEGLRDVKS